MKRASIVIGILSLLFCVRAEESSSRVFDPAKDRPSTPEEIALKRAWVDKRRYEHFGGELIKPGTMNGVIAIVNCQSSASQDILNEAIDYLRKESHFDIQLKEGAFTIENTKLIGDFSLFVVESDTLPTILLAPENKWAVLNIEPLKAGRGEKPAFFKARILKEISRTFAGLCGGISSNYPDSLTTGIYNLDQLDRQEDSRLSVDVIARFAPSLATANVTPAIMSSYLAACKQGWAPAPTNDVQKAIWEKVKAEKDQKPTNPIKVTYDPKTAPKVEK